jgi:FdrA protein
VSAVVVNRVRSGFYLDSVALMRASRAVEDLSGVEAASLMIGTDANRALLKDALLLDAAGATAGANDLIVAVRAADAGAAEAAIEAALGLLDRPAAGDGGETGWNPKSLDGALRVMPDANLAIVSVPGAFAAREARRALDRGLNVMVFSDNVPVADERALKEAARDRGLLMMGPDCGTAIIGGAPLGFANAVPAGDVGIVSASGTGLQEVSCLIARAGGGISHAIGVGGRDLSDAVGGITTLAAIDALDADPATTRVVLISKPPGAETAARVFDCIARSAKPFTICIFGMDAPELPANAAFAPTLRRAAELALGDVTLGEGFVSSVAGIDPPPGRDRVLGLYTGGTLCAEAQAVLMAAGEAVRSNAPIPGALSLSADASEAAHELIDLGADEYTLGRPHPMIEPSVRGDVLADALADPNVAVVLLDVVIGYGAHDNPAGEITGVIDGVIGGPAIVASVCGTDDDPQVFADQVAILRQGGVHVAPSNADAAELALSILRR